MLLSVLWLVVGLAAILVGANLLVDGSSALAKRLGMSDLLVGLTVVAFGTSTPELAISVISAAEGSTQIAVGNVVGSNTANILLIIGMTALVRPIAVTRTVMTRQMPLMVLSAFVLLLLGNSGTLNGTGVNMITRTDGIVLMLLCALFMIYTVKTAQRPDVSPAEEPEVKSTSPMPLWRCVVYVLVGLAGLVWGGDRFVDGASELARAMGVSEAVIGLTIVAVGTSMPELAASVVAAWKGNSDLAVGNVIGSNIFNVTLVLGASAAVRPLQFGAIGNVDLGVLCVASLLFWLMGRVIGRRTITRGEGAALLCLYAAYLIWLVINAQPGVN